MLTNIEVLAALSEILSPGELSQALEQILRAPEAWRQLHVPGFIEQIAQVDTIPTFVPGHLASLALGVSSLSIETHSLPEEHETQLKQLWQDALNYQIGDLDFEAIALLAIGLLREYNKEGKAQNVAHLTLQSPEIWQQPLAYAWPYLSQPEQLLSTLINEGQTNGISLAAQVLLANMSPDEAAQSLLTNTLDASNQILLVLQEIGEHTLFESFARASTAMSTSPKAGSVDKTIENILASASRNLLSGDRDASRLDLNRAWESASHTTGSVADQVADFACLDGDPVVEVEARQQALRCYPTPSRRALLSLALIKLGQAGDALATLQHDPEAIEEQIAAGIALAELGETSQSVNHFRQAVRQLPQTMSCDDTFFICLIDGLKTMGDIENALLAARFRVQLAPTSIEARINLSQLFVLAGDPHSAAGHANLALALDPNSDAARHALAHSLQVGGRPDAALPHWQTLADTKNEALSELATCALEANQIDLARETAERLLEHDNNSPHGQVVLGKALAAMGDCDSALDYLERATQAAPHNPEAWIALADCQMASGDVQAAGASLSTGVQSAPEHGSLQIALSRWLNLQGRTSDALEAARKATELERNQAPWLIEYSDLLRDLGHHDQAFSVLQEALARQPENWETRRAMALAYEERGEVAVASHLLNNIPPEAAPEAYLLAGRILAKSTMQGEDPPLKDVVSHFMQARSGGCEDPSIDYWLGMVYEHAGQTDEAFLAYQACLKHDLEGSHDLHLKVILGFARTALAIDLVSVALSTLEEERKRYPTSIDLLLLLAKSYLTAELPDLAIRTARQAVDLNPTSEETLRILSRIATDTGSYKEAIQAVERLVDIRPDDVTGWLDLAELSQKTGNRSASRHALAQALRLGRRLPHILRRASEILVEIDDIVSAIRMLRYASSLQPKNVEVHQELASLSEQIGDLETAQQAWRRCIELQPDEHMAYSHAAQALWELDRRSAAIGLWQRAVSLHPEDSHIQVKLARAYLANGEAQRALNHYAFALELNGDDAELNFEAGEASLRHGSTEEALIILQKSVQLSPDRVEPLIALGECFLNMDRLAEAREALQQVIEKDSPPQRAFSMLALTTLGMDALPAAKAALQSAATLTSKTREDVIWFSQAALRMGNWQQAVDALEEWLASEDDVVLIMKLIHLRLRLLDAHWLYTIAADAHNHAPETVLTCEEARHDILALINTCHQLKAPKPTLDALELWFSISNGSGIDESLQSRKTIKRDELWPEIIQAQAIAFLRKNRYEEAQELLSANPDALNPDAWGAILLGLIHSTNKRYAQARHTLQVAAHNPVIRPLASFLSARAWLSDGHAQKAATCFNTSLAAWPNEPAWHFQLASLYQKEGELDAALPHMQQTVELAPEEGDYLLSLARALRDAGQLSEAEAIYARAIEVISDSGQVWKEAGQLALANGHFQLADTWFERACTLSPSDVHCIIGSARTVMALGQRRQAMERAQAALRLAPDDYEVLLGMGEILAEQGKFEKALQAFDRALLQTGNPINVQLARCKLLIKIGRAKLAVANMRKVLETRSDDQRLWAALAEAYEAANQYEAALDAATQAVRLSPRNPSYRMRLGRLCRKSGQLDRALDELAQAQSISPTDAFLALELGRIHETRREPERALEAYNKAIELDANNDQAHFRAGLMLKRLKKYQQAANMIERAVELNPRDHTVLHQLAAVRALELIHGGSLKAVVSS